MVHELRSITRVAFLWYTLSKPSLISAIQKTVRSSAKSLGMLRSQRVVLTLKAQKILQKLAGKPLDSFDFHK